MMDFRVSDEQTWAHEFEASDAEELARGIRRAWREYCDGEMDPVIAFRARMAEIDAWEREREGRDVSDDVRRSWTCQARHWRGQARRQYGAQRDVSPLTLHLRGPSGQWLTISASGHGASNYGGRTRVIARETVEHARGMLDHAHSAWEHDAEIAGVVNFVSLSDRPHLTLVGDV